MEKRSSRGPSSICVEKAINPECLPGSDIRVDSVGCRGFGWQMTALRHGHRRLRQTGRDPKPPTSPLHPRKVGFGASSPIRRAVSHRQQSAETRPLRRDQREGELRTLRVIRLRQRDQPGSTHIPARRSASSTDAFSCKVDRFLQRFAILYSRKVSSESPRWLHLKSR
jgi:hypothetical protein